MDRSFKFWDRLANRYAKLPLQDEAAYLEKLRQIKEHLDNRTNVLEFGCGTGSTAILLGPHSGRYRAIDYSCRMIALAEEKASAAELDNLSFECAAFDDFDAPAASYDVVIGMNILHLLRNWPEAIEKAHVMLKPGGVFFSSTACMAEMDTPMRHISRLGGFLGLVPILRVFTLEELTAAHTDAGFKIFHQWQPGEKKPVFIAAVKPLHRLEVQP